MIQPTKDRPRKPVRVPRGQAPDAAHRARGADDSIRIRVLAGSVVAMGPGKADLLDAIAAHGSISAAGRAMGMSYRRAWMLVRTMNTAFREPLVVAEKGGVDGGGATLTPLLSRPHRDDVHRIAG